MANASFITHITVAGERWDSLAWQYYGDATLISPIIQTNPQAAIEAVFEGGLTIGIPLITIDQTVQNPADKPPWR